MILFFYAARLMLRFSVLIGLVLLLIAFLDEISGLGDQAAAISWSLRLAIAAALAVFDILDFLPIILMLAVVLTLSSLGRRGELHVVRGAGLSGPRILTALGVFSFSVSLVFLVIVRPLSYEASQWAQDQLNPGRTSDRLSAQGYVAWFSAENGRLQGRLEGYDPNAGSATHLLLSNQHSQTLENGFAMGRDIQINGQQLQATVQNLAGQETFEVFDLDESPRIRPVAQPNFELPLPHLLGLLETDERWGLGERQRLYLIQRALAEPLLAAVLTLLAGTLSVEVGTRQPIGRLVIVTLSFVVFVYSIYVMAYAFGLNGKLNPWIAAWGLPLTIGLAGFCVLACRDLLWHLKRQRLRPSILA